MVMAKKKKGKKVRVALRRTRTQPARDKSWTRQFNEHGFENTDTVNRESLIPKGDMSRKRTIIEDEDTSDLNLREGRAIATRGLIIDVDDGERIWPCTVRRILRTRLIEERHPVAVGDVVQFMISSEDPDADQAGVIYNVYARTSQLTRRSGERVHVIAANVDQVLIVASADEPPLKPQLIDRYLVAAHAGDITPLICINKIDLSDDEEFAGVAEMYRKIGYRVILASAATGEGIDVLKAALAGKETVVAGQSGVGKSTLLNAIQPGLQLTTAEVSQTNFKGKHTTTTALLLKLAFGGYVVDTPGVRSYDLAVVPKNEFELHFVEFVAHVPNCRFPDCTHIHEGGCAIKQAVEDGLIDPRRYESYCRLFEED